MMILSRGTYILLGCLIVDLKSIHAFSPSSPFVVDTTTTKTTRWSTYLSASSGTTTATKESFIQTELRGAAMKLHTKAQAPKEGQVEVKKPVKPYTPTHLDYLKFLVDSQYVYEAMEDIVNNNDGLTVYRNTGLERTKPLEIDIEYITTTYNVERPSVGDAGTNYANKLRQITSIPEFVCHYYNHYFAHTAGGLMIGKRMSALLLEKKTLEFYKWDGDINKIKETVKDSIEDMAASWNDEEKQECVAATAAAFQGGGAINSYLSGGRSPH